MNYRVALMPKYKNRPGYRLASTSLTIHNTANPNATAANHETYLNAAARSASWHISVDDKEAVLHIPLNEQAWHTGTNAGNTSSIGIEVCEFSDPTRQQRAFANAEQIVADMLTGKAPASFRATHLNLGSVRTHQSWSGKYCPRLILPWWGEFVAHVRDRMTPKEAPVVNGPYTIVFMATPAQRDAVRDVASDFVVWGAAPDRAVCRALTKDAGEFEAVVNTARSVGVLEMTIAPHRSPVYSTVTRLKPSRAAI